MNIKELKKRLDEIGIKVSEKTLRRWGDKGLIKNHLPQSVRTGRSHSEEWREDAFEEAAAVWALRYRGLVKALSKEKIDEIRRVAERVYASPKVCHELPPEIKITTPNPKTVLRLQEVSNESSR